MSLDTYLQNALLRLEEQTALLEQKTAEYLKKTSSGEESSAASVSALKALLAQQGEEKSKLLEENERLNAFKKQWDADRAALLAARENLSADCVRLTAERDDMRAQKDEIGREKDAYAAELRRRSEREIAELTAANAEMREKLAKYDGKDEIYQRQSEETEQLRAQLASVAAGQRVNLSADAQLYDRHDYSPSFNALSSSTVASSRAETCEAAVFNSSYARRKPSDSMDSASRSAATEASCARSCSVSSLWRW